MSSAAPSSSQISATASTSLTAIARAIPPLVDEDLARELERAASGAGDVLIVANAFTVAMLERSSAARPWSPTASGEFGSECKTAAGR